LIELKEQKVHQ